MTDVTAQAFREAAEDVDDYRLEALLLAAAEQREQVDKHQQQLSAALAIVNGFDMARPDDDEGGQLHNLRNILTGARETKHESTAPAIFLCQVCDQTPERGHAPDCPGSTGVDVYLGEVDTLKQQIATLTAERDEARALARQAVNGWACYAKREAEHDEISEIHAALDALKAKQA